MIEEDFYLDDTSEVNNSTEYKDFKQSTFYGNPAKSYIDNMKQSEADKKVKVSENKKELDKWK